MGAMIENAKPAEVELELTANVPLPADIFETVTCAAPVAVRSVDGIAAFNCVAPMNVVVRGEPFQFTTEPLPNPLPYTVRVNAAPPLVAVEGLRDVRVGGGLLMVKTQL